MPRLSPHGKIYNFDPFCGLWCGLTQKRAKGSNATHKNFWEGRDGVATICNLSGYFSARFVFRPPEIHRLFMKQAFFCFR